MPRNFPSMDVGMNFLYSTVDWARQLSFFNDLTQRDQVSNSFFLEISTSNPYFPHFQVTLLQSSWVQLFVLCAAGSSVPLAPDEELTAKDGNAYMVKITLLSFRSVIAQNCSKCKDNLRSMWSEYDHCIWTFSR